MPAKKVYPNITVNFSEVTEKEGGNAWAIIGICKTAMRDADCTEEQVEEFEKGAKSKGYDHLIQTVLKNFNVVRH